MFNSEKHTASLRRPLRRDLRRRLEMFAPTIKALGDERLRALRNFFTFASLFTDPTLLQSALLAAVAKVRIVVLMPKQFGQAPCNFFHEIVEFAILARVTEVDHLEPQAAQMKSALRRLQSVRMRLAESLEKVALFGW